MGTSLYDVVCSWGQGSDTAGAQTLSPGDRVWTNIPSEMNLVCFLFFDMSERFLSERCIHETTPVYVFAMPECICVYVVREHIRQLSCSNVSSVG